MAFIFGFIAGGVVMLAVITYAIYKNFNSSGWF